MLKQNLDVKRFPKDFLWGVASASYQIEGAVWANGRGCSIWDTYARTPGKVYESHNADEACDHYHRWEEDLDLMRRMGLSTYRFSIAWPRIFPEGTGRIEPRGLDFYDRLLDGILKRGMVPMATLYHWDLPQELEDRGGWPERETAYAFADYTEVVLKRLGDRLPLIATINEPFCVCFNGYYNGRQAPGRKNMKLCHHAAATLMLAHGLAVQRVRALAPKAQVGIVMNTTLALPNTERPEDAHAAELLMDWENRIFLDPIFKGRYPESFYRYVPDTMPQVSEAEFKIMREPTDWFGLNYYFPTYVVAEERDENAGNSKQKWPLRAVEPPPGKRTSMDWMWCIVPSGLTELLKHLKSEYGIEKFYITENGSSWEDTVANGRVDDPDRQQFLLDHLSAVADGIEQGIDVKGYYYWSFYDNFEWSYGYRPRFGLYYTDYPTQTRILKDSGFLYSQIIKEHTGS